MQLDRVPVSSINPAPYNPQLDLKPGDPDYERLRRSIPEFGCVEPWCGTRAPATQSARTRSGGARLSSSSSPNKPRPASTRYLTSCALKVSPSRDVVISSLPSQAACTVFRSLMSDRSGRYTMSVSGRSGKTHVSGSA
jgi:hypothetical protein